MENKDTFVIKNPNLVWADNIRFIATIFVVMIHVTFPVVDKYGSIDIIYWQTANIIESVCRSAVPLFVMLSGTLLLGKNEHTKIFYNKRLKKIAIPFLIWSLAYLVIAYASEFIIGSSNQNQLVWILIQLKKGTAYHLWYIYMILGLYFTIPYLSKVVHQLEKIDFYLFFGLWILTLFMNIPVIKFYFPIFDLTFFTGYIGYLLLGYFLTISKSRLFSCKSGVFMFIAGWFLTVLFSWISSDYEQNFVGIYYNYLSPNVAMMSTGIFIIIKEMNIHNSTFNKVSQLISKYSFGVYLNHVLIITILYKLGINWKVFNPILGTSITFCVVMIFSVIIVWISEKINFRKYLG